MTPTDAGWLKDPTALPSSLNGGQPVRRVGHAVATQDTADNSDTTNYSNELIIAVVAGVVVALVTKGL